MTILCKEVQSALDEAASITELSESAKYYMIANDIAPTIDGIYKAENAVSTRPANSGYEISFKEFNAMRPQIESLMNKAGLEVNLRNLNNAQDLINNNIPVTEKTLKYKAVLDGLNLNGLDTQDGQDSVLSKIADQLAIGEDPKDTPLTNDPSIWDNVKNAIVTLANASYDDIVNVVSSGKAFTIASLKVVMQVGWSETAESRQAVNNQMTVNNQMSGDWQGNVNSQMSGGWQGNVNNQYGYVQDTGYNQGVYNNQMGGNYAYQHHMVTMHRKLITHLLRQGFYLQQVQV